MKKIHHTYFPLVLIITIIFFIGVFSLTIKYQKSFTIIDKVVKDTTLYLGYVIEIPINKTKEVINKIKEQKNLTKKYEELVKELEKTDYISAKYNESLKVIEELENMLNLNGTLLENNYINATVISRNLDFWYDKISIDKGEKSGIEINDAVVTPDGLIGKVISTSLNTSDVKLLTSNDINQKISVKIKTKDDYAYGLLTGYEKSTDSFIIEGISGNDIIDISSEVTTTGLGDVFPSGILIGYVKEINKDHFDLARILKVKSKVNFNSTSYVTVLKRIIS